MDTLAVALRERIRSAHLTTNPLGRSIALYSAAVTVSDESCLEAAIDLGREHEVPRSAFYEAGLQSYLFLGFPRMLVALEHLGQYWPEPTSGDEPEYRGSELADWRRNGEQLCKQIYGEAYEPLKRKVLGLSPELFQWMVHEGYGKVLSRPGLGAAERELAICAMLMMENRGPQLHSHLRGALRTGSSVEALTMMLQDIGPAAGDGFRAATALLERLAG